MKKLEKLIDSLVSYDAVKEIGLNEIFSDICKYIDIAEKFVDLTEEDFISLSAFRAILNGMHEEGKID